ncbi:hypothetical protein ACFQ0B_12280 [Nonomuraea thailandensis]
MTAIVVSRPASGRRAAGESCRYDTGCRNGGRTTPGVVAGSARVPTTGARIAL